MCKTVVNTYIVTYTCKVDFLKVFTDMYFLLLTRIEDKIYQFWKEGDFGYVKSVQDNLQFVCKPEENEVRSLNFNLSCVFMINSHVKVKKNQEDIDSY